MGNTVGGLISGYWIKYTGRYKWPTVVAPFLSIITMILCYTTWNGHTDLLAALAVLPGGMAAGMMSSSSFVGLAAGVSEEDMAVAGSGLYLFFNLGAIAGSSAGSAVYQTTLKSGLQEAVKDLPEGQTVSGEDGNTLRSADKLRRLCNVPSRVSHTSRTLANRSGNELYPLS